MRIGDPGGLGAVIWNFLEECEGLVRCWFGYGGYGEYGVDLLFRDIFVVESAKMQGWRIENGMVMLFAVQKYGGLSSMGYNVM